MKNVAIFASGNGSNFEAIVKAKLNCDIKILICNKSDAYVLERALMLGIDSIVLKKEENIIKILEELNIDLIVLAGYMKIFSENFVSKYEGRIVNIHPSLLPKYRGLNAIERAFNAGEKEIGISIHYVDFGVDTGEVIAVDTVSVEEGESLDEVEAKVHELENRMYPKVLEGIL